MLDIPSIIGPQNSEPAATTGHCTMHPIPQVLQIHLEPLIAETAPQVLNSYISNA